MLVAKEPVIRHISLVLIACWQRWRWRWRWSGSVRQLTIWRSRLPGKVFKVEVSSTSASAATDVFAFRCKNPPLYSRSRNPRWVFSLFSVCLSSVCVCLDMFSNSGRKSCSMSVGVSLLSVFWQSQTNDSVSAATAAAAASAIFSHFLLPTELLRLIFELSFSFISKEITTSTTSSTSIFFPHFNSISADSVYVFSDVSPLALSFFLQFFFFAVLFKSIFAQQFSASSFSVPPSLCHRC